MNAKRKLISIALVAIWLAAAPAAQASTPFQFGMGSEPDIAVDDSGTAHVVWKDISPPAGQELVYYCRIPHGKRGCEGNQALYTGTAGARPHVLLPGGGQVVVLLGEDQCGVADFCTFARRSTNGGVSFGSVQAIADPEGSGSLTGPDSTGDAVHGPGDSVSYVNASATAGMFFTNAPLGGGIENGFARLYETSSTSDGTVGLDGSRPVVAFADQASNQSLWWRAYGGSGSLNDQANWTPRALVESNVSALGDDVTLAGGPGGLYLMYKRGAPGAQQYVVRKFTGTGFGAPRGVSEKRTPIFGDLYQDGSGRLHAVWVANGPDLLQWRTSKDGAHWGPTVTIDISGDIYPELNVAAAPSGQGFAAWDTRRGPTGAASELEATPLEPYTGPKSKVSKKDKCKWPNCLPAGGKASKKVGKKKTSVQVTIPSCKTKKVKVKLTKLKHKTGNVVVSKVLFQLGKQKKVDKKPAYGTTFKLKGATLGKKYTIKATVFLKIGAKQSKVKLSKAFYACPLG